MSPLLVFIILISTTSARRYGSYGRSSGRGSHGYPQSTGYSGHGSQTHTYPQYTNHGHGSNHNSQPAAATGGGHSYPSSTGLSGSGQQQKNQHTQKSQGAHHSHTTKTEVHNHYHYNPPPQVTYGAHTYPVYHGTPPTYVYEYRNSESRFGTLLAGLALYNLGKMSASHHHHDDYNYKRNPGEVCKLGISKDNGDYEETRIDCQLMSSFIWEAQATQPQNVVPKNTVTSNVVNVTTHVNGTVTSSVSVTNTTVVDALDSRGPSIQVTPGMKCFLMRIARDTSIIKKTVECGMLQAYTMSSLKKGSERLLPLPLMIICSLIFYLLQPLCPLG